MILLSAAATTSEKIAIITVFSVVFVTIFALIVLKAVLDKRRSAKRVVDYRVQAKLMGLHFAEDPGSEAYHQFDNFKLFTRGKKRRVSNLIEGDSGDVKISIFDYEFLTGGKKSKVLHQQTVIALRSAKLRFPEFSMRPEIFWTNLALLWVCKTLTLTPTLSSRSYLF